MTTRPPVGPVLAALTIVLTGLTACSSDPDEAYCEALREQSSVLKGLAGQSGEPGTDVLGQTLASLRTLQEEAPSELEDEYATVVNAWEAMVDVVADVGIDPAEYDRAETLRRLDPADARRVRQTADALASQRVGEAGAGIEDHAGQVCGVDFGA